MPVADARRWERGMPGALLALWRGTDFTSLLLAQVEELERGLAEWQAYLADGQPGHLEAIDAVEEAGDRARLAVVRALDEHFITPLDREDLYALARAIDAVLDAVEIAMVECGQEIREYGAIAAAVAIVTGAVAHLRHAVEALLREPDVVREESVRIHRAAKAIDRAARDGLRAEDGGASLESLRWVVRIREINHYLRAIGDRLDLLADVLMEIVVKSG